MEYVKYLSSRLTVQYNFTNIFKMPAQKRGKMAKKEDKGNAGIIEGISSVHSWIKAQTMVRPANIGRTGSHDSEDDEEDIQICLSSRDPNINARKLRSALI